MSRDRKPIPGCSSRADEIAAMSSVTARCLILACGNTLRRDDGIGPWLCAWAEQRFSEEPLVETIARQQWTPDLAEEIARASHVLFVDCSLESEPGEIKLQLVEAATPRPGIATHHVGASELLQLAGELFGSLPRCARLLTIGAGALELGEEFSGPVQDALPHACCLLEQTVREFLEEPS